MATDDGGRTAFMWAAGVGHPDTARLLIEEGTDVNSKDNDGETALMTAVQEGYTEIVELLQKAGAKE